MLTSLSARLHPAEVEERFREDSLPRDARVARALVFFAIGFHASSMPMDRTLLGESDALTLVWAIRGVSVAFGALAYMLLDSPRRVRTFDDILFGWIVLLLGGIVLANAWLPPEYLVHIAWDVLLTLAVYTVAPLPFPRQLAAGLAFSAADLSLFVWVKEMEGTGLLPDVLLAFFCTNLVGGFAAWEMHRSRRRRFEAHQTETRARMDLEQALDEIRTLRGIIPICASCKKVRTDEGQWEQVEAYVRDHSNAEFSHGMCPTCAKTYYDELEEPARSEP